MENKLSSIHCTQNKKKREDTIIFINAFHLIIYVDISWNFFFFLNLENHLCLIYTNFLEISLNF